jgi:hypothetical protein
MQHILAVLLVACTGACAPVVTHSPRVQPGVSLYVSGVLGTADVWEYDIEGHARRSGREKIRHVMVGVILDTRAPASARRPLPRLRHHPHPTELPA